MTKQINQPINFSKMKNQLQKLALSILILISAKANAQTVSDFESLTLVPNSYWDGASAPGGTSFISGNAIFPNYYDAGFSYWVTGWGYSNMQDSTTAGFANLYSAIKAIGYNGSSIYAEGTYGARVNLNPTAIGKVVNGFYITNSTIAALSMRDGDAFAKKFGGPTGNDPDWFKLTIRNWYGGVMTNDSVEFYLADYRFANNTQDYIVKTWQWVDLTSLGNVDSLSFELSSTDAGAFGINTPAYFCIDNFSTADVATGVNQINNSTGVNVFPNPSSDFINVQLNNTQHNLAEIKITDITGRIVFTESTFSTSIQIPLTKFPKGTYNITVSENAVITSKTFIKQ